MASMDASLIRQFKPTGSMRGMKIVIFLIICLGLVSCGGGDSATEAVLPTVRAEPSATVTAGPTPPPETVLLLSPETAEDLLVNELRLMLEEITATEGQRLELASTIANQPLDEYKVVVMPYPDEAFWGAVQEHPEIVFVAIAAVDATPEANLWIIGNQGSAMDQAAFLSGYIAALVTPEWRIGAIESSDSHAGGRLDLAFIHGGIYFCGLCRPQHPPFYAYPTSLSLSDISETAVASVFETGVEMGLHSIWVPESVISMLDRLQIPSQIAVMGVAKPVGFPEAQWIASVRPAPDERLAEVWDAISTGEPGEQLAIPILVADENDTYISPGKMRLIEITRDELVRGFINTGAGE